MTYVDDEEFVEEPPSQYHPPETEALLQRVHTIIAAAKPVPLSSESRINKEQVLDLLEEALTRLPEELRAARWLLKERDEFLVRTAHEADEIIQQARARVERMVTRTEVVKAADHRAYAIVEAAEAEARRMRHEVEDFCDQQLARFEIILERTLKMVAAGRQKLQTVSLASVEDYLADDPGEPRRAPAAPSVASASAGAVAGSIAGGFEFDDPAPAAGGDAGWSDAPAPRFFDQDEMG